MSHECRRYMIELVLADGEDLNQDINESLGKLIDEIVEGVPDLPASLPPQRLICIGTPERGEYHIHSIMGVAYECRI